MAPWQKPWAEGQFFRPYNPTTGNRYRGINVLALMSTDYTDSRWMTYKQAQAQGWQVRGGERSTQIQHWIWEEERVRTGPDGQPVLDSQKRLIKDLVRLDRPKVITAAVFNAQQIDGIPELGPYGSEEHPAWDEGLYPREKAEQLLKASGAKIEHSQNGGAYYRLSSDTIHLPSKNRFVNPTDYFVTALHELGHWTGHLNRLDRDLGEPFGSVGYAREELRAEIASLIVGSQLGLGNDSERHAGYVDHWVQILTDTPKEILYAAADAERISEYILTIEQKKELRPAQELGVMRKDIPQADRKYLSVPYAEREEAKALGARWDAVQKSWYVGSEADLHEFARWDRLKHQSVPPLDSRTEFAAVLREIGAVVKGDHPVLNGEPQRIPAVNDKRGDLTIFYIGHADGVPNGYAQNNRTKQVIRWKATGQYLSSEAKADLAEQAEQKRYARKQAEGQVYEATAARLAEEMRNNSVARNTAYHEAKGIEATPGAPSRAGDVLVPGYDVEGKLWTIQYIKEDGIKRFAKNSRKHGCFHVIGALNAASALQKIAVSPVVVIAEGYATAATLAKHAKVPVLAAYDSGNLLSVAAAVHERWPDKGIVVAGDDDHGVESNPGRQKALAAAEAVAGVAIFPNFTADQRSRGLTDFNDLGTLKPKVVSLQLDEILHGVTKQRLAVTQSIELARAI
jgi:putative DNA primase/helicase